MRLAAGDGSPPIKGIKLPPRLVFRVEECHWVSWGTRHATTRKKPSKRTHYFGWHLVWLAKHSTVLSLAISRKSGACESWSCTGRAVTERMTAGERGNPPFLILWCLLMLSSSVRALVAPLPVLSTRSRHYRPLAVVADAEDLEELHKKRDDGDADDSWIPTMGGFLPNLAKRNQIIAVETLQDYKRIVVDEPHRIVCVRFYAPWCRACRAVQAPFRRLASLHSSVKFIEVPLTPETAFLHQGLGVPSLPFAHIYHPDAGLVEEQSINKKMFAAFTKTLQTYIDGQCAIDWEK